MHFGSTDCFASRTPNVSDRSRTTPTRTGKTRARHGWSAVRFQMMFPDIQIDPLCGAKSRHRDLLPSRPRQPHEPCSPTFHAPNDKRTPPTMTSARQRHPTLVCRSATVHVRFEPVCVARTFRTYVCGGTTNAKRAAGGLGGWRLQKAVVYLILRRRLRH